MRGGVGRWVFLEPAARLGAGPPEPGWVCEAGSHGHPCLWLTVWAAGVGAAWAHTHLSRPLTSHVLRHLHAPPCSKPWAAAGQRGQAGQLAYDWGNRISCKNRLAGRLMPTEGTRSCFKPLPHRSWAMWLAGRGNSFKHYHECVTVRLLDFPPRL